VQPRDTLNLTAGGEALVETIAAEGGNLVRPRGKACPPTFDPGFGEVRILGDRLAATSARTSVS